MRLLRLKLNERFRSLPEGFEIHFLRDGDENAIRSFNPYCLVGRNGSGKSNVLEVLAAIFYHLECTYLNYRPEAFDYEEEINPLGFKEEEAYPNAFELSYLYDYRTRSVWSTTGGEVWKTVEGAVWASEHTFFAKIEVIKEANKSPVVYCRNLEEVDGLFKSERLDRIEIKSVLPSFVLAYSSGENEILSLPFYKMRFVQLDEYVHFLTQNLPYGVVPEGRLVFLDQQFNQAIVLCNFLLQDQKVLAPFQEEVGLEHIYEFRLIIRRNRHLELHEDVLRTLKSTATEDEKKREFTDLLNDTISKLQKCSTAHFFDPETEILYLDYWVNSATQDAFRFHFNDALGLFQAFQILLTLNLISVDEELKKEVYQSDNLYISETLPTPADKERVFSFGDFRIQKRGVKELIFSKSLSDGEHQFLHTLGLCLLFKDESCLFLLDEPETHLNPDWRSRFISRLRDCFSSNETKQLTQEMLITSHSPFIVSDSKQEYVLVFHRDENTGLVRYTRPDFKTFGASVNQITIKLFDKPETIGGYAYQKLQELEKRFAAGEDGMKIIKEANHLLGDSVEKIMFIDKILDQLDKQ